MKKEMEIVSYTVDAADDTEWKVWWEENKEDWFGYEEPEGWSDDEWAQITKKPLCNCGKIATKEVVYKNCEEVVYAKYVCPECAEKEVAEEGEEFEVNDF